MSHRIATSVRLQEKQGKSIRESFLEAIDPSNPDDIIANAARGYSLTSMSKIYDAGITSAALRNKLSATLDRTGRKEEYYEVYIGCMYSLAERIGFKFDDE